MMFRRNTLITIFQFFRKPLNFYPERGEIQNLRGHLSHISKLTEPNISQDLFFTIMMMMMMIIYDLADIML